MNVRCCAPPFCIFKCLYERSSECAHSKVPGLVFACHAGVLGLTPFEIIIFKRRLCTSFCKLANVWVYMYIYNEKESRCNGFLN